MRVKYQLYIHYALSFLGLLQFSLPVWVFISRDYLRLSYIQIYILTAIPFISTTLFELPTGSWSDRYGRKLIFAIGAFAVILGDFPVLVTKNFHFLALGLVLTGFGAALKSGTLDALLYEYIEETEPEDNVKKTYRNAVSNKQSAAFLGRATAAIFSGSLYLYHPLAPVAAYIASQFILMIVMIFLQEPDAEKSDSESDWQQIKSAIKFMLGHSSIRYFAISILWFSFVANILFFAFQPLLESVGLSIREISYVYIAIPLFSVLGSQSFKRLEKINDKQVLASMFVTVAISALVLAFVTNSLALVAIALVSVIFGLQMPLTNYFLNHYVENKYRSTSLSALSLGKTLAYSASSIATGLILQYLDLMWLGVIVACFAVVFWSFNLLHWFYGQKQT